MNIKRMRGRNHRGAPGGGGGGGPIRHQSGNIPLNRNHVFDSNGPDLRIRGTAQQLFEKYLQLGRDATSSGDRVMAESYFQHAEHYFRILGAMQAAQQPQQHAPHYNAPQQQPSQQQPSQQAAQQQGAPHQGGNGHQQPRRFQPEREDAAEPAMSAPSPPGLGEQPSAEPREVPIAAAAPRDA